ncbi:MAG: DNA polymerase I, partial [Thermofilum sp. ex4484_82]
MRVLKKLDLPSNVEIIYFDDEKEMIKEIFNVINQYPIVITFNGDNFDLRYLYHRAIRLGFKKEEIPIELTKDEAHVKYGVHIDLYKFFYNNAIKVYAFGNAYKEVTLDTIAKALLGTSKVEIEKPISELSLEELAHYNYQDAKITLDLTTFNNNLTLKLIILLMRISRLPMEDLVRQGVSSWVKSLFYAEHRIRNYLIPRPEEITGLKGTVDTTPIIKGKKYKGAIVVEPKPGVHFNVVVLDFASLYPSVIKKYNLSYETVRCVHPECRDQKVPETNHWVCKKRRGLTSQIIGFLRDIRVKWFKPMSKNKNL